MSTRWICRNRHRAIRHGRTEATPRSHKTAGDFRAISLFGIRHSQFGALRWFAFSCLALSLASCGMSGGRALWALGVGSGRKTKAEFKLGPGPILILVDDATQQIDWPAAFHDLNDELAQHLIKHKATTKVIPRATIETLRRTNTDFSKKSAREIGELADAEQVMWIETQAFLAKQEIDEASDAALWQVTVKVLDARQKEDRTRVRLWPATSAGQPVSVSLSGADVDRLKTRDALVKDLARQLSTEITKLFVDHKEGDFDR